MSRGMPEDLLPSTPQAWRAFFALATAAALALAACSGGVGTATETEPAVRGAASTVVPADPDRAFAHVHMLASTIGPRAAGSAEERAAADYLAAQLADAGYDVSIDPFPVPSAGGLARVAAPGLDEPLPAYSMSGAPQTAAEGTIVLVPGHGSADDFASVATRGAVVITQRGVLTFATKAQNAERAGAVALLVVNNEPGELRGTLANTRTGIPVLGLSLEAGAVLGELATAVPETLLSVRAETGAEALESQNVVARPPGRDCDAYLGAHYDSVPTSAGANDNASGAAMIVELARVLRGAPGAEELCVVAFGAEEVGLVGSEAFVDAHDVSTAAFMLNFDMVGKMTMPLFVRGDAELATYASMVARDLGEELPADDFPPFASSDHATFALVGVPAITVHSGDDVLIHSPQDDLSNVSYADLGRMLRISEELARRLLAAGGVPRE